MPVFFMYQYRGLMEYLNIDYNELSGILQSLKNMGCIELFCEPAPEIKDKTPVTEYLFHPSENWLDYCD
jgi:hypothetical protein